MKLQKLGKLERKLSTPTRQSNTVTIRKFKFKSIFVFVGIAK